MYLDPALAADIASRREHLEPGQDIAVALDSGGDPIVVVVADGDPESASQPYIVVTDADENALDFAALAGQLRDEWRRDSLAEQDLTAWLAAAGYDPQAVADAIARYEGADTTNIDGVQYYVPAAIEYELPTAARATPSCVRWPIAARNRRTFSGNVQVWSSPAGSSNSSRSAVSHEVPVRRSTTRPRTV
jgi:hypothetical protein